MEQNKQPTQALNDSENWIKGTLLIIKFIGDENHNELVYNSRNFLLISRYGGMYNCSLDWLRVPYLTFINLPDIPQYDSTFFQQQLNGAWLTANPQIIFYVLVNAIEDYFIHFEKYPVS